MMRYADGTAPMSPAGIISISDAPPVNGAAAMATNEMMVLSGRHTVPQIWIGEQHVGGYDDLALLERQGRLDELLQGAPGA